MSLATRQSYRWVCQLRADRKKRYAFIFTVESPGDAFDHALSALCRFARFVVREGLSADLKDWVIDLEESHGGGRWGLSVGAMGLALGRWRDCLKEARR